MTIPTRSPAAPEAAIDPKELPPSDSCDGAGTAMQKCDIDIKSSIDVSGDILSFIF